MTKNKKLIVMNLILVSLLSGCAAPRYKPPTVGPTAKITFSTRSRNFYYDVVVFQKPYSCENPILTPGPEFRIPAKKLFTFEASYFGLDHLCGIAASFTPDQNQQYLVNFSIRNGKCILNVSEKLYSNIARGLGSNYLPVPIAKRKYKTGILTNYCSDKISKEHQKINPTKK